MPTFSTFDSPIKRGDQMEVGFFYSVILFVCFIYYLMIREQLTLVERKKETHTSPNTTHPIHWMRKKLHL